MTGPSLLACLWLGHSGTLVALALKSNVRVVAESPAFANFIQEHGRTYRRGSREYEARQALFDARVAQLERHNSRPSRLWTAGINHLTDRTDEELAQLRGWRGVAAPRHGRTFLDFSHYHKSAMFLSVSTRIYSETVSWTHLNSTNIIVDQGACGSCWAIASATVLAAHSEIYKGDAPRSFSAQQLVSCVSNPYSCGGKGGCDGATVELALDHVMRYGLSDENAIPYEAKTSTCTLPASMQFLGMTSPKQSIAELTTPGQHVADASMAGTLFGMRGWTRLPENKYEPLMRAISDRGPVAISVAALTWSSYRSGIFDNCVKDAVVDHAVTLIGFGYDHSIVQKYWHIQNSWGSGWGEGGTIRLLRRESDEAEYCGIDRQPEVGTGCMGGPPEVQVCGMCGILYDSVVPHFE